MRAGREAFGDIRSVRRMRREEDRGGMMKSNLIARCFVVILLVAGIVWAMSLSGSAQSGRRTGPPPSSQTEKQSPKDKDSDREKGRNNPLADETPETFDENGTIKMDTTLVTIPVSVVDRDGKFVPFLARRDFRVYEDGVEQSIEIFNSVRTPFHVALVIDTSRSTVFKLEDIQDAAIAFIKELKRDDQVMVVSFDTKVRLHCDFTSDYDELRHAIYETRTGGGTKLYEAVDVVVERMAKIQGRKAIVLFTDGVDTSSRYSSYEDTIEKVEEADVLVYPIKYDTEMDIQQGGINLPNIWPWPLPSPDPRGRRRWPLKPFTSHQFMQWPPRRAPGTNPDDYRLAARYLQELADHSGGRLYNADTLYNVTQAFTMIAEELRHQYALGYYSTNAKRDGTYRQVKVRIAKNGMIVRARKGYRAASGTEASDDAGGTERPELKRKRVATQ
jgi:Ca-activated chloride channel homolog